MKRDDQQIDDLFKDAFGNQTFDYQPDYFKEVEKVLYPNARKRWIGAWLFLSALFVGGTLVLLTDYLVIKPKTVAKVSVPKTKEDTLNRDSNWTQNTQIINTSKTTKALSNPIQLATISKDDKSNLKNINQNFKPSLKLEIKKSDNSEFTILSSDIPTLAELEKRLERYVKEGKEVSALKYDFKPLVERPSGFLNATQKSQPQIDLLSVYKLSKIKHDPFNYQPVSRVSAFRYRTKGMFVTSNASLGTVYSNAVRSYTKSVGLGAGYAKSRGAWGWSAAILGEILETDIRFSEATKYYSYDVTYFENALNYSSFYKIDFPVWGHFKTGKHDIHAGFVVSQIFQSKLLYTYSVNGEVKREETIYGEKQGINSTLFQLQTGYGMQLTKRLIVGANISYSLNPIVQSNQSSSSIVSPLSGQLYLRHNIRR
jgi:preprotein translocase subunit SecE